MTRKTICMLIALVCVTGVAGMVCLNTFLGLGWFGTGVIKEPLKEFSYSSGGDMRGSFRELRVKGFGEEHAIVSSANADWHGAAPKVKEYKVSNQVLKDIQAVFNEYNMSGLEKRPKSQFKVLDGATSSYSFSFSKQEVHFSSSQNISAQSWEGAKKIRRLIMDYCKEEALLPGLVLPEATKKGEKEYSPRHLEKGKLVIALHSYKDNTLNFYINNGTDKELMLNDAYSLVQLSPKEQVIATYQGKYPDKCYAQHVHEKSIRLKKRLEAGKYRLTYGDISKEFEIK